MAGPLDLTIGFLTQQCADAIKENVELAILQLSDPKSLVSISTAQDLTGNVLQDLLSSPLGQLGQDYLSSTVNKTASRVIDTIAGDVGTVINNLENIQQTIFNTLIAAMLAKNDIMLYLLQRLAKNIVTALNNKRSVAIQLQDRLRQLHNAMMIVNGGNNQYAGYLGNVRKAVVLLFGVEGDIRGVRDTFSRSGFFQVNQFQNLQTNLQAAIDLIEPPRTPQSNTFDRSNLLAAVGLPTDSEALTALMSIPVLAKDCLLMSEQYFTSTAIVNALLSAFIAGLDSISKTSAGKFKDYTVTALTVALDELTSVRMDIASAVNGDPNLVHTVKPVPFRANTSRVTNASVSWLIELKTIRELLKTIPVQGLNSLQLTNNVVDAYRRSVKVIKSKNNRFGQLSELQASEGQENVGSFESQLLSFLTASQQVITQGFAPPGLLSLSRGMQERVNLTLDQDSEITTALQSFINTKLPDSIDVLVDSLLKLFRLAGMDRAADLLDQGLYDDFFGSNSKTSTYVGAAMVGAAALAACLGVNFPFDFMGILKGFFFAFTLKINRVAGNSIRAQFHFNLKKIDQCTALTAKIRGLGSVCGLKDSLAPSSLFNAMSGPLGVGAGQRITG